MKVLIVLFFVFSFNTAVAEINPFLNIIFDIETQDTYLLKEDTLAFQKRTTFGKFYVYGYTEIDTPTIVNEVEEIQMYSSTIDWEIKVLSNSKIKISSKKIDKESVLNASIIYDKVGVLKHLSFSGIDEYIDLSDIVDPSEGEYLLIPTEYRCHKRRKVYRCFNEYKLLVL